MKFKKMTQADIDLLSLVGGLYILGALCALVCLFIDWIATWNIMSPNH